MLSKITFVNTINALEKQSKFDSNSSGLLSIMFKDVIGGFYDNGILFEAIENLLTQEMNDTGEWIIYFLWELDFGKNWDDKCCKHEDGSIIDISTPEKLYDFLIEGTDKK